MGFGLMTGFDTARNYTLQFTVRTADVPLPLGSQTAPDRSYIVLTATAHND
jgi:hypothetical protein